MQQKPLILALLVGIALSGAAQATLIDRGAGMVYDTVLDITWTQQAGDGVARNWAAANAFAATLEFGGFDDWRLPYASVSAGVGPTTTVVNCATSTETACRDNEMGYLFYYNLDGIFGGNKTGTQIAMGGVELTGIQRSYWSGTELTPGVVAWDFGFSNGDQGGWPESDVVANFAWAVRSGDVAAVPVPAAAWLLGSGLLGLIGVARRRLAL